MLRRWLSRIKSKIKFRKRNEGIENVKYKKVKRKDSKCAVQMVKL